VPCFAGDSLSALLTAQLFCVAFSLCALDDQDKSKRCALLRCLSPSRDQRNDGLAILDIMSCWLCGTGVGVTKTQLTRIGQHSSQSRLLTSLSTSALTDRQASPLADVCVAATAKKADTRVALHHHQNSPYFVPC